MKRLLLLAAAIGIVSMILGRSAFAYTDVTKSDLILMNADGTVVEGVTASTSIEKAQSKVTRLPDGDYWGTISVRFKKRTLVFEPPVIIEPPVVVEPTVEPTPDPPIVVQPSIDALVSTGATLQECIDKLLGVDEGWCGLGNSKGMMSVADDVGLGHPRQSLEAWSGAAFDEETKTFYFTGGGHGDSSDNALYSFNVETGTWKRLHAASPLTHLVKRYENIAVQGQYIKSPDLLKYPGAAHTYDGVVFNKQTKTLYVFSMRPGGRFIVNNVSDTDSRILDQKYGRSGQYEFNPSETEVRNGIQPLAWKLVGNIPAAYPKTTYDDAGNLYLGHSGGIDRVVFDGDKMVSKARFVSYASWGDGGLKYDPIRGIFWVIHDGSKMLFGYGKDKLLKYSTKVKLAGKSIAFDSDNNVVIWDGCNKIATYSPEENAWDIKDFVDAVPSCDYGRVYSKWVSLGNNLFVGVSKATTPVYVYKKARTVFTTTDEPTTLIKLDSIPYGDIGALQGLSLLPKYGIATHSVNPRPVLSWSGAGGERPEIGLFTEQYAAYIAGQVDLADSTLLGADAGTPNNREHAHQPNAFWLPFLMTGDVKYIASMEKGWALYADWRRRSQDQAIIGFSQREAAWNLRDLVQLAWLQKQGLTEKKVYIKALNATRDRYLDISRNATGAKQTFHILDFNGSGVEQRFFTGWMSSMMGQVIAYTAYMTQDPNWVDINKWHFTQLLNTSGDEWPLKSLGYSHVFFKNFVTPTTKSAIDNLTWDDIKPYSDGIMSAQTYIDLPDNKVIKSTFRISPTNYTLTFKARVQSQYAWAMLSCYNAVARACEKALELKDGITAGGFDWEYKHGVIK